MNILLAAEDIHVPCQKSHPVDMEVERKAMTIREFATCVLADKDVKQAVSEFYATRNVADRLIDACVGFVDTGTILLHGQEEESAYTRVIRSMNLSVKADALETLRKCLYKEGKDYKNATTSWDGSTSMENVAPHVFRSFCFMPEMERYLLHDELPFMSNRNEKIGLQEVFCLFVWLRMSDTHTFAFREASDKRRLLTAYKENISYDENGEIRLQYDNAKEWGCILLDHDEHRITNRLFSDLASRFLYVKEKETYTRSDSTCIVCFQKSFLNDINGNSFCTYDCKTEFMCKK